MCSPPKHTQMMHCCPFCTPPLHSSPLSLPLPPFARPSHTHHDLEGAARDIQPPSHTQTPHRPPFCTTPCFLSPLHARRTLTVTWKGLLGTFYPPKSHADPTQVPLLHTPLLFIPLACPLHTHRDLEGAVGDVQPPKSHTGPPFAHPVAFYPPCTPFAHPLHTHHDLEGAVGAVLPPNHTQTPHRPPFCTPPCFLSPLHARRTLTMTWKGLLGPCPPPVTHRPHTGHPFAHPLALSPLAHSP